MGWHYPDRVWLEQGAAVWAHVEKPLLYSSRARYIYGQVLTAETLDQVSSCPHSPYPLSLLISDQGPPDACSTSVVAPPQPWALSRWTRQCCPIARSPDGPRHGRTSIACGGGGGFELCGFAEPASR